MTLKSLTIPNRVVMAPMTRSKSPHGIPGEDVASYYARRAATGLGLILTEGVRIPHYAAVDDPGAPDISTPEAKAGWTRVVNAVHQAGGRIAPQLWHQGPMWTVEMETMAVGKPMRPSGIWGPEDGVISIPAANRDRGLIPVEPMTESEIGDVIAAYGRAARDAMDVGFDAIAIHGAHGYLIDSFLWDYTNRRTDRWGGPPAQRADFGAEVVRAIRAATDDRLPIILRISQFKLQNYKAVLAETPDLLAELLGPLADAGVSMFDCSQRFFDTPIFDPSPLNLAGWVKKLTGTPSMTVGGVALGKAQGSARHIDGTQQSTDNLHLLVARFERGEFDCVAVGRAILNDPDWFAKALQGQSFLPFNADNLERLT